MTNMQEMLELPEKDKHASWGMTDTSETKEQKSKQIEGRNSNKREILEQKNDRNRN